MGMRSINNTFNRGELDPTLLSRDDVDLFQKGARRLRNMIPLWTGAARIAPGTRYVDSILDRENSNAVITNTSRVIGIDLVFDADNNVIYTIILRPSGSSSAIDIYFNNTRQATITSSPYSASQIPNVHFVEGQGRVLLLHEDRQIRQLKRGASHTSWTLSTLTPSVFPTFDYSVIGEATDYTGFTFNFGGTTPETLSTTGGHSVFTANHVGGLFRAKGGVARITKILSVSNPGDIAELEILEPFTGTSFAGNVSILQEKMWTSGGGSPAGANRGWPARGTFFLDRLMLGRSKELKNMVAVSTAGIFDNFDDSDLDATSSFSLSLNGRGEQSIQSMVADDSIIFLTTNKVYAQSPLVEDPLTPENVYFAPQIQSPAADIEAATIDNQILYVAGNKGEVLQLVYNTDRAKYVGTPASLLAGHLFGTINSNATWEPQGVNSRLYMATQTNGTLLFYSTLVEQQVAGWSLRTTRGKFIKAIGTGRQAHVLVQRQINLGNSTFETSMDRAFLSDNTFKAFHSVRSEFASASGTSSATVLEDENNYIVLGNDIPFTALNVTLNTNASTDLGLEFQYLDHMGFWNTFTPTDNTNGFTGNGSITWSFSDVLNWEPNTVNDIKNEYWIRIKRTTETVSTNAVVGRVQVNTGERIYLEKFDFNKYTDSSKSVTSNSSGVVTGLGHLAGHQVFAVQGNFTTGPYFVNSSGQATIKNLSATVDIGIQYKPELVPMPLFVPTQEGDNMYDQKYVQDLFIDYVDSLYLKAGIGDTITDIPNLKLGNYTLGQQVSPQTGIFKINPRGDWEPRQSVTITQSQPGPMTIIGIGYHVEIT